MLQCCQCCTIDRTKETDDTLCILILGLQTHLAGDILSILKIGDTQQYAKAGQKHNQYLLPLYIIWEANCWNDSLNHLIIFQECICSMENIDVHDIIVISLIWISLCRNVICSIHIVQFSSILYILGSLLFSKCNIYSVIQ